MGIRAQLVGGPRDGDRVTFADDRATWAFPHDESMALLWTKPQRDWPKPRILYYTRRGFHDINEQGERLYRYEGG